MKNFVSAIIVAAGGSVRMGIADSKQFLPLLGKPAIEYTLRAFQKCHLIREIIVVCREQDMERIQQIADENGFSKVKRLVPGGASRAESVRNGTSAADENTNYYAIHDGARPLITVEEIERVTEAAFETGAATLGTSVTDTIKIVNGYNVIESTPLRSQLRAVQTPQVFEKDLSRERGRQPDQLHRRLLADRAHGRRGRGRQGQQGEHQAHHARRRDHRGEHS